MRCTPAVHSGGFVARASAILEFSIVTLFSVGRRAPLYHIVDRLYFLFHTGLLLVVGKADHILLAIPGASSSLIFQLLLQLRVIHGIVFLLLALVLL